MRPDTVEQTDIGVLWALRDLPPFPWIATKVLQMFSGQNENIEIKRLIELIRADAAVSSEILRRANSVLYGLPSRIASLRHAVVILGMEHVKTLAMTTGMNAYLRSALRIAVLRRCWRHSVCCALISEVTAPALGFPPDQGYTAGLLHDVGRLALLVKYPQPYADLLSVVVENNFSLLASERDLFDVDHCQAGEWLAREWNFPEDLADVAAHHHETLDTHGLAGVVGLSCRLADRLGFSVVDPVHPERPEQIIEELPRGALRTVQPSLNDLRERLLGKVNALE